MDGLFQWVAWHLPWRLAYFATVRLIVTASWTNPTVSVGDLTVDQIARRDAS